MDKIQIKMLESMKGRDDDEIQTKSFIKGESYFVGAELHHVFVKQMKVAENKMVKPSENKTAEELEAEKLLEQKKKDTAKKPAAKKTVRKTAKRTKK